MITVQRYNSSQEYAWNQFVAVAKNGHFLFKRQYMDYHADRFIDYSLMLYDGNKLIAIFPATLNEQTVISHGGLTFGGVLSDTSVKASIMLRIFEAIVAFLREQRLESLVYKAIPYIYHKIPAEEDLYAIYRFNGKLIRRDLNSVINLQQNIRFSKGKMEGIKKATKAGLHVMESVSLSEFFRMGEQVLARKHQAKPTHTAEEMESLANKFPDNIKLFGAYKDARMLAGIILYQHENVVHTQYMFTSEEGGRCGALDIILKYLITVYCKDKKYFSFGVSTENNGLYLNEGLVLQKEMFSARAVVHDTYEIRL
jgi:hypothetical protein